MPSPMKTCLTIAAVALALVAGATPARATTITIVNASFEDPAVPGATYVQPSGWVLDGGGGGVWNLTSNLGGCPGTCWNTTLAPDGTQIGWLSVGPQPGTPASLTQTLSDTLLANSTYTLTGYVGHPNNFQVGTVWTAELIAGSTVLASASGSGPAGSLAPFTLSYFSGSSPAVGETLQVRLSSNQAQTGFDAIALSVPDGGMTALLLGLAMTGLGIYRRTAR